MSLSINITITSAIQQLSNSETPRLDVEILLCHILKKKAVIYILGHKIN